MRLRDGGCSRNCLRQERSKLREAKFDVRRGRRRESVGQGDSPGAVLAARRKRVGGTAVLLAFTRNDRERRRGGGASVAPPWRAGSGSVRGANIGGHDSYA